MGRRAFLKRAGGLGLGASLLPFAHRSAAAPGPSDSRPNILFIWTDQQCRSAMSNAGNPHLQTPAMDAIAREGVAFENAYCSNPICVPSRTSWLTAQMPHVTGVQHNINRHPIGAEPASRLMKEHGYDTGYVGKWHIPHPVEDTEWHGFDFVGETKVRGGIDPAIPGDCARFLKQQRDKPFFLVASFVNPHDICEWARAADEPRHRRNLPNGAIPPLPPLEQCPPLPDNLEIPEQEPEALRRLMEQAPSMYPTVGWPDERWRKYLWAYYRMVEEVDAYIGTILHTLRETGLDENTVIVFGSDHGDGCGAHRWNQKIAFYEEVAGVPWIVRPPKCPQAGSRDDRTLVNINTDFFPTVFDYAGIPTPSHLPGKSLRPVIEQRPGAERHSMVVSQSDLAPNYGKSDGVYGRMLRSDRYKYVVYSEGAHNEQLFDLESDPGETRDLKNDPAHQDTLKRHRALLKDWMREHNDPFPARNHQPVPAAGVS